MSILSTEEVQKIANLARMAVSDEEATAAASNLSGILEHFTAIRSIDTTNVPPADDVSGLQNVMREDIARDDVFANPKTLLHNADAQDGYVRVSAVFADETVS